MSKKRTSAESNDDEQQNEGSDSLFQQGNNAKRAKLASLSDTTLQDLPMELIEFILMKVVTMEVKGMKLVKSVWKEKADLVINRLGTVCSYWSSILSTDFFRNEVDRILDATAPETIRLEILRQSQIPFDVTRVTTLKDEMFMICREMNCRLIVVYNRNTMARLKDVIAPPRTILLDMAGCSVSNCVYVLGMHLNDDSILRITKDEDDELDISLWINIPGLSWFSSMSVSSDGNLIILSGRQEENPAEASIYDANGLLQHKIMLPQCIQWFGFRRNAILKSNGNLVLVPVTDQGKTELLEIDATGSIERKYKPSRGVEKENGIHFADTSGRYVITEWGNEIRLLDSELNLLDYTGPQLNGSVSHYSSERNEVVSILSVGNNSTSYSSAITIFRFIEE